MREAGDVCYADVHRNGCGIVEFLHEEDARYAIRHLDDTKFRSHEVDSVFVLALYHFLVLRIYL